MVLVRHPLYVAIGATISVYGIAYALTGGDFEAAAVATLPGAWLAAHGLLNGIALATDGDTRDERSGGAGGDAPGDGGGEGDYEAEADGDEVDALSSPVVRTPY